MEARMWPSLMAFPIHSPSRHWAGHCTGLCEDGVPVCRAGEIFPGRKGHPSERETRRFSPLPL